VIEYIAIKVTKAILITFGILIGVPYVLALIGLARVADRAGRRRYRRV